MTKIDAILTADWHIRADTPRCRTDNFIDAMWEKVDFICKFAYEQNCPILIAGDIGHRPQWPNWLIEKFISYINKYRIEIIAIPGQHDLPDHNLRKYKKSAIGVLSESESIKLIGTEYHFALKKYPFLFPFPYSYPIKKLDPCPNDGSVAITHQMVIEDKEEWPGQVATSAKTLLKKFPNYKLILSGDNHKPFVVKYKDRLLVNPGSMMRTTAAQIDHRPRIYIWEAKRNKVEAVYLPIAKNVIDRSHIDIEKERDTRIEVYTERLNKQYEQGLSFEENLKGFLDKNRVRKPVHNRIWEACEL